MTLASLFLLQLFISPLFLSVALIRWSAGRDPQEFVPFFNTLACAAVYAAIFAGRTGIKQRHLHRDGAVRPVLPAIFTGACYGVFFVATAMVPCLIAEMVRDGLTSWSEVREAAKFPGLLLGGFGCFLGAFGGAAAGIVLEWSNARGGSRHQEEADDCL
jgi:hypothetical protein